MYLIVEKSGWKDQVRQTRFLTYKNQFRNLFFVGYTGSKNPIQNRLKIQFVELDFFKIDFLEIKYRSARGKDGLK